MIEQVLTACAAVSVLRVGCQLQEEEGAMQQLEFPGWGEDHQARLLRSCRLLGSSSKVMDRRCPVCSLVVPAPGEKFGVSSSFFFAGVGAVGAAPGHVEAAS